MRSLLILITLMFASPAFAQQQVQPTPESNQYWHLKQERIEAYRAQDRAYMERLLAPNFVGMGADGQHATREQYLAAEYPPERQSAPQIQTEVRNFTAARTGSTLVLAYQETERSSVAGQRFEMSLARTDVYARQGGRWRLLTMTAVRLPEPPATIEVSTQRLAEYVGVYEYGPGVTSTVRLVDGRLLEQSTGNPEVEMLPVAPDEFYCPPDFEARAAFERDAQGHIVAQTYRSGSQVLRAVKME